MHQISFVKIYQFEKDDLEDRSHAVYTWLSAGLALREKYKMPTLRIQILQQQAIWRLSHKTEGMFTSMC